MINDELNTAFRWYDDILKQNRYKPHCAAICDFRLISPTEAILPFQFRTELVQEAPGVDLIGWDIMCEEDDSLYADLDELSLNANVVDGVIYISYFGGSPLTLDCGNYYMRVILQKGSDLYYYYSEVFQAISFSTDSIPVQDPPLFTAWRFYDDINKQYRYTGKCAATCDYYLISPNSALLPFQFRIPYTGDPHVVEDFKLVAFDGSCEQVLDIALVLKYTTDVGDYDGSGSIDLNDILAAIAAGAIFDYFYYGGDEIANLPCGRFYAVVTIDGVEYYSELIELIDISVTSGDGLLTDSGIQILTDSGIELTVD